jgi:hypothetical protein
MVFAGVVAVPAAAAQSSVLTLTASTTAPAVNQPVTFTAILKSGTAPLPSKSVTVYHYLNGVKYTDVTQTTNVAGQITLIQHFGSRGQRQYYATFAGDSIYFSSTSSVLIITVSPPYDDQSS